MGEFFLFTSDTRFYLSANETSSTHHNQCLISLSPRTASAHHAFAAEFDPSKEVHFTGTVTKMEWVNAHAWLHIDVKKPDDMVEN